MADTAAITIGPDGNMWFTQEGIQQHQSVVGSVTMGGVIVEYPVSGTPVQIAAGSDGALWFDEQNPPSIGRITTSGSLTEYPIPYQSAPDALTSGPDGNIWFTDVYTESIGKVKPNGSITEYPIPRLRLHHTPLAITNGPDGDVWFTLDATNQIGKISPHGHIRFFKIPTPNSSPEGIALGSDGNLYFTESETKQIGISNHLGQITEYALPSGDDNPIAIVPGYSGSSMWIVEQNAISGTSQLRQFIIRSKVFTPLIIPPYPASVGWLHFGPDGNMWMPGQGTILVYLTHVLTSNPASVDLSDTGQTQTIQIHETQYKGGAFTAQTSDPSIATVAAGNQTNSFVVTGQGVGSCSIRVSDSLGNYIDVPVTVE